VADVPVPSLHEMEAMLKYHPQMPEPAGIAMPREKPSMHPGNNVFTQHVARVDADRPLVYLSQNHMDP
jgi:hypothetical protein